MTKLGLIFEQVLTLRDVTTTTTTTTTDVSDPRDFHLRQANDLACRVSQDFRNRPSSFTPHADDAQNFNNFKRYGGHVHVRV